MSVLIKRKLTENKGAFYFLIFVLFVNRFFYMIEVSYEPLNMNKCRIEKECFIEQLLKIKRYSVKRQ